MYPHHLYLKNFLSYGPQGVEVDFSPYQTVLLVGANGAGKSSILDALLWSIWGKTRFGSDTDVMHSGSTDMEVRLDFVVNGHTYRIIRKRSKKGKGFVSVLELQSLTEPITVLTDATINKTQERIDELVGVDYELLISSAFLRQGDAAEFTHKSPSKRKELLSAILHLDQYQQWHEESKLELKQIENSLLATQGQREYLQNEKNRLQADTVVIGESLASQNLPELEAEISRTQGTIKNLEGKIQAKKEALDQIRFLQSSLAQTTAKSAATKTKLQELGQKKTELSTADIANLAPVDHQKMAQLSGQVEILQREQAQRAAEEQTLAFLKNQFAQHEEQYTKQLAVLTAEIDKIESKPLVQTNKDLKAEDVVTKKITLKTEIEQKTNLILSISEKIAALEHELQMIVSQGNVIKDKRTKLEKLDHNCPLCEQTINDNHKKEIIEKYEAERSELLTHYNQLKEQKELLEQEKKAAATMLQDAQVALEKNAQLQEVITLLQQIASLGQRKDELIINHEAQTTTLTEAIKKSEQLIQSLTDSSIAFAEIKTTLKALQDQDALYRKHQEQMVVLQGIYKEIEILQESLTSAEAEITELQIKINKQTVELSDDGTIEAEIQSSQGSLKLLLETQEQIKQQQNMLAHLQREIQRIDETIAAQDAQNGELHKNRETLSILVEALGYRGIPTMIIEEAIPRLEQYANDILSFLSDNTMSIRFSLTRTSKTDKDNQIETLDILIGDTFGTRAYELFSGGEAFRIDIALRLALTKLLTERSNGKIDFLVIDEGFGSQDEGGKDHIMQIIHKLEKYFKLIIIITHVDSLKETFPDRLLVRKGPQGSEIVIDQED